MANAKKPKRSWSPFGESSSCQNTVARMKPVSKTVANRAPNSSGVLRELVRDRFVRFVISI